MKNVCGEIIYTNRKDESVHSDICVVHEGDYAVDPWQRKFLHACLDEWIDKSRGSGIFWVGDPDSLQEMHQDFMNEYFLQVSLNTTLQQAR